MTTAEERTRAVVETERFLLWLENVPESPQLLQEIRERALRLSRHYPDCSHMRLVAAALPIFWAEPAGPERHTMP
ncbi:BPSL0761 family protein [Variovorax sp. RHLX14]|uniref:BPSL0761 family protein n=1 Tax=Variovorax sp. RHLX14 TaxID=1259731 RepID=UPI003F45F8C7